MINFVEKKQALLVELEKLETKKKIASEKRQKFLKKAYAEYRIIQSTEVIKKGIQMEIRQIETIYENHPLFKPNELDDLLELNPEKKIIDEKKTNK